MDILKLVIWVIVFLIVFLLSIRFPVSLATGVIGMYVGATGAILLAINRDRSFAFAAILKLVLIIIVNIFINNLIRYSVLE
jgi:hypothetical protein